MKRDTMKIKGSMNDNSYRRYHLAHDEGFKELNLIHKFDTNSLTVLDLWKLRQLAYQEGYFKGHRDRTFIDYGLED